VNTRENIMDRKIGDMGIKELQEEFGLSYRKAKKLHRVYCQYPEDEREYRSAKGKDFYDLGNSYRGFYTDIDPDTLVDPDTLDDDSDEFFMRV
tara:strand:+ start:305 stop:583 length:279 start_codon:yes stop_codon:yes gene_type:complete